MVASATIKKKSRASRATRGQGSWSSAGKTPSLILKIHAGALAGDAYAEKQTGAQFVDSNMLGLTAQERLAEFRLDSARHPRVKKNLFVHVSLSRPSGLELTLTQWGRIARQFLSAIGAEGCQYICTRHTQTKNDHIHLTFGRAKPSGELVSMSHNRWKWREAVRQVERDIGLADVARPVDQPIPPTDVAVNALRRAKRRGTAEGWVDPEILRQALARSATPDQFAVHLRMTGIEMKAALKPDGKAKGILFRRKGAEEWLAGTSIGREFSLTKIQAHLAANHQAAQQRDSDQLPQRQRAVIGRHRQKHATQDIPRPN